MTCANLAALRTSYWMEEQLPLTLQPYPPNLDVHSLQKKPKKARSPQRKQQAIQSNGNSRPCFRSKYYFLDQNFDRII